MICKALRMRKKNQVYYQKNKENILHNKKIYYTANKKVINKKKDCDRNIFTELSRCERNHHRRRVIIF